MQHERRSLILFGSWFVLGITLATILMFAWFHTATMAAWTTEIEAWRNVGSDPVWWQRSDSHLHMTCSILTTIWWGFTLRLFTRVHPLAAVPLAVLTALSDELCQLFSSERTFDWTDQYSDGIGITIAIPILLLLARQTSWTCRR